MLCIFFFFFLQELIPQVPAEYPSGSLTAGSFAGGLSNLCADTSQPVSKDMHPKSPAERFIDPGHSEVFHEAMKTAQERFTVRKTGKKLKCNRRQL